MFNEPPRSQGDLNFSVLGIPVRVHPMFWVVTVLLGLNGGGGRPVSVFMWVVAVFISILVHEMGHALVIRANGWQPWITLHGFGGLASYQPTRSNPWTQIVISLAGPAAGFALAVLVVAALQTSGHEFQIGFGGPTGIRWYLGDMDNPRLREFTSYLLFINIFWGLVNLLPIYPLDGGQISRQLFHLYGGSDSLRQSLWLSVFAAGGVAIYGASLHDMYLAIFFGYMAYSSYMILQSYFGRGGGAGGGWR